MTRPIVRVLEKKYLDLAQHQTLKGLLDTISAQNKKELFKWKEGKEWKSLSSSEYIERVKTLACYLRDTPTVDKPMIQKGDRVAFLIYNGPEWHIVRMACTKIGAVSVPILTEASTHDLEIILQKSQPKTVIVKDSIQKKRAREVLAKIGMNIPVLLYTIHTMLPVSALTDFYESILPRDLAMIFFTSGTTSDPKGVMHTHRSLLSNVGACRLLFNVGEDDIVLSFLPVSHIFQQTVDTLALQVGATIVYVEDPRQVVTALPDIQPTIMASVPRMFELITAMVPMRIKGKLQHEGKLKQMLVPFAMKMGEKRYSSSYWDRFLSALTNPVLKRVRKKVREGVFGPRLKFFVSGGAPLTQEVGAFMQGALELPIYQGWGMTEVAGAGTCNTPRLNILGSCGKPLPGTEIELRRNHLPEDLAGDLPEGVGEVFFKGPVVMQGYYNEPEATAEAIQNGWLKTSDIGRIDKHGALWITGRKKDVLVLENGLKVHEEALSARIRSSCPFIEQIVLFGHKKPYIVGLVHPNVLLLKDRVQEPLRTPEGEWSSAVKKVILDELKKFPVAPHERVKDIALLPAPLSTQDGTLTPTQKPRHRTIQEKYGDLIESMYR